MKFLFRIGLGRRNAPPPSIGLPPNLDDASAAWKTGPGNMSDNQGNGPGGFAQSGPNSFGGPVSVFPNAGQGSPAGNSQPVQFQGGPPTGSNTPQYTASPAPSGSSTPGPAPPQNVSSAGFPPPPNSAASQQYNGPNTSGPFGSPSNAPPFGRPGSSGPAFGPSHFASPNNFTGPQFGMPSNSPFGHGHPMSQIGPSGHMMGGPQPMERMDQG